MKIALVHDYLKGEGGAEQVLLALHEIYPNAPIYTIFSSIQKTSTLAEKFKNATIIESWFGKLPYKERLISPLRFLIPLVWKSFDFSPPAGGYDLIISSASWAITKGLGGRKVKEICYCHTPPRYLYGYETSRHWKKHWFIRIYASVVNLPMRQYDFTQAQKVTWFIANSEEVARRIQKFYRRDSVVIYPPVEIKMRGEKSTERKGTYFLTGGRLEMPKNFDLIIRAFELLNLPLKIYGVGPQEEYLRSLSQKGVEFLGLVSDEEKQKLLSGCRAFICAATDEDFGITPLEAQACGRPVVAFRGGGYLETVIEGKTGEFFDKPTPESLASVLKKFKPEKYKAQDCFDQAAKFSKERFKKEIQNFVKKKYAGTTRS